MDIGDYGHVAAALAQAFDDMLQIACILHCRRGDPDNLTAGLRQLDRLLDGRLGVHRIAGDHRLDTDRIVIANANVSNVHLARSAPMVLKRITAIVHRLRLRVRAPFAISFNTTIIFTSSRFVPPFSSCT